MFITAATILGIAFVVVATYKFCTNKDQPTEWPFQGWG